MKRFIILCLVAVAALCNAQEITEPGWFKSEGSITLGPGGPGGNEQSLVGGESSLSLDGSGPIIAESITPEIEALARGLEHDPLRIYNYVHDNIRHVFYFGSKKGAQLTLLERSGNDFDQCALLVALLRASGYSPSYQFGIMKLPYERADHKDLKHWLQLSFSNTNWSATLNYFSYFLYMRGYPDYALFDFGDSNTMGFHRVWVKLPIDGVNYLLDPAFKVSESVTGINLTNAMRLDTNSILTAAGGTNTADYAQGLNEFALRNKLCDYSTNLLSWLQTNAPNASVDDVLGGWKIQPSTNTTLSQSLSFIGYDHGGKMPILTWDNEPANLMSGLAIAFAGTNYQWFIPDLQGQRLSMTFDSNGVARLWQEDTLLVEEATSGTNSTIPVALSITHPHGIWNTTNNTFTPSSRNNQSDASRPASYQRTNATYALIYSFNPSPQWLRNRQDRLDAYRQATNDVSREVVCETLNVMGMSWMLQKELVDQMFGKLGDILCYENHCIGRVGQEKGKGYYVDVYMILGGPRAANGNTTADNQRNSRVFDLSTYFASALEHAVIEQYQSSNLVAASTIKMLQLANTNLLKVFLVTSDNWTSGANIRSQLTNYDLSGLDSNIVSGRVMLLPSDGLQHVSSSGSWTGYGIMSRLDNVNRYSVGMLIGGAYFGGYVSLPNATTDPILISLYGQGEATYFNPSGTSVVIPYSPEPVRLSDGAYELNATDLSLGQAAPRGFSFTRSYNSARRRVNPAGMAHGWTHNFNFNLMETSAAEAALGQSTPAQMVSMLVAARAALEIYSITNATPKNWLTTVLIAKWGVDQLIKNSVSITLGPDTIQFVRQPDGSFTPPANSTMTLAKTNASYTLTQRHGNAFQFDSNRRLTNIVDQYGKGLALNYNASNWVHTATDWKGRVLTLDYSGSPSRLTSVSDGTRTVSYGYSTQGDLNTVTDPESQTSSLIYDASHQIIATKDALNQLVVSNLYDGYGRVIEQYNQGDTNRTWRFYWSGFVNTEEDPIGARRRYFFDDKFRHIGIQDALGNAAWSYYDGQDHVVMTDSPSNKVTQFQFDGRHNMVKTIDPLGKTNTFNYDSQNLLRNVVDANGNVTSFGYNDKFQVNATTNGAKDWVTFGIDTSDGKLNNRTDPAGTTTYSYDSQTGYLTGITYPSSLGSEGFLNNRYGDVTNHTNGRGYVTVLQYNARRQLTNTIEQTVRSVKISYDAAGNPQSLTDARTNSSVNYWSPTGKLLGTVLPSTPQGTPSTTNYYDSRELLLRTLDPLSAPVSFTNDLAGRLVGVTDPLQRPTSFVYDANGWQIFATNAAHEVTRKQWTDRGELALLTDNAQHTVGRVFDPAGNLIYLTNRNGNVWQFRYDAANRLTNTITPLNRETRLTYDNRGLLSTIRKPSGQLTTNCFDARGRLTNRADSVASTLFRYDANNNHTAVIESAKTNTWVYDTLDRVTAFTNADGFVIQYRSDANGNVTNMVYPGNRNVYYAFDNLNRLTNVTDWANRKTSYEYDLASRLKKVTRPNGTIREVNYDAAGQTTNIWEKSSTGAPVALFNLSWNNAGRVEWEFAAPQPHAYTPPTRTMTPDADNRIANLSYDDDGNLTNGPSGNETLVRYNYDARNRLLSVGGTASTPALSYGYDSLGNRTSITNGTNVTRFVVNPNAVLSQCLMRIKGGVTNIYVYGVGLLYEVTVGTSGTEIATNTYHFDYRGSTVAITDAGGMVRDRMEYSVFGMLTYHAGTSDTPFLFNGQYGVQSDPNGLLFMRARYYNPYLCRFINADPSGFAGGLNAYAFGNGNPISLIDPYGLSWETMDLYGSTSDMAVAGWTRGGLLGSLQGNMYSAGTALLDTIGGRAVGATSSMSGIAAGEGRTGAAIGWGGASVGLIALNAYTGGQSASAVGKLGTYVADPILYEIGSKTLPTAVYERLGLEGMTQIEKGAVITEALYGGNKVAAFFIPVATTAYTKTIPTGLTPGAAYLLNWGTQGANAVANAAVNYLK